MYLDALDRQLKLVKRRIRATGSITTVQTRVRLLFTHCVIPLVIEGQSVRVRALAFGYGFPYLSPSGA
jgi:hypothetical protein